jgi:hypothetical protein
MIRLLIHDSWKVKSSINSEHSQFRKSNTSFSEQISNLICKHMTQHKNGNIRDNIFVIGTKNVTKK